MLGLNMSEVPVCSRNVADTELVYDRKKAMRFIGCCSAGLADRRRRGLLPTHKIGRQLFWSRAELEACEEKILDECHKAIRCIGF
jgi:hypothetical protein